MSDLSPTNSVDFEKEYVDTTYNKPIDTLYEKEQYSTTGDVVVDLNDTVESDHNDAAVAVHKLARTSTVLNTFYLMVTDVLGPQGSAWSISTTGYITGGILYVIFGFVAAYCSYLIWRMYIKLLDRDIHVQTWIELVGHLMGPKSAKVVGAVQLFSMWLAPGGNILLAATLLNQTIKGSICFNVQCVIFLCVGIVFAQIKQLHNVAKYVSVTTVTANIFVMMATVGLVSIYAPLNSDDLSIASPGSLYQYGFASGGSNVAAQPVAFTGYPLSLQFSGISGMVYAYGGATIYVEFIGEMKNPRDFWKSLVLAQITIIGMYLFYGMYVYTKQGEYSAGVSNQGISNIGWQNALDCIIIVTATGAGVMYGNVFSKVVYTRILQQYLGAPNLHTNKGTLWWAALTTTLWSTSFVFAIGIPLFNEVNSVFASFFVVFFSYTLPPLVALVGDYNLEGKSLRSYLTDSIATVSMRLFNAVIFLGSLAAMGMLLWGSIVTLIQTIQTSGNPQPFACDIPY